MLLTFLLMAKLNGIIDMGGGESGASRPIPLLPLPKRKHYHLERAKRPAPFFRGLRGLSNGIFFSTLHKHVIGMERSGLPRFFGD